MEGIDNFDVQELKSQLDNMKQQVDLLQMQNNSVLSGNPTKEQLFNLSFQLINNGIHVYKLGQKQIGNIDYDEIKKKLQKVSDEINALNTYFEQDKMMQLQKLMQMPNLYPNLAPQYMMAQNMMQQPMINCNLNQFYSMNNMIPNQFHEGDIEIKFMNINGNNKKIKAKVGSTVGETLKQYRNEAYGNENTKLRFIHNALELKLDDSRKVEVVLKNGDLVTVMEC